MVEIVFSSILRTAIISSIGICIILILKKILFKEYTKSFNYYIWLIVIFRMILPFKIPVYISQNSIISNYIEINNSINRLQSAKDLGSNIESINNSLNGSGQVIKNSKSFINSSSVLEVLCYIWLSIALIIIAYRIFTYIKFKNTIVDLSWEVDHIKIKNIYNNLLKEMKLNKNILLRVSDYTSVPLGIGFFKSYILLPNVNYEEKEVTWILKHELMHYKKNDILYKFLIMAVTSIYWFNPLVYLMNRYISIECELACDEKILNNCDFKERKNYALTLINSLKHKENDFLKTNLATKLGNKKILKRRFESMFSKKTKKGIFVGLLAIVITTCSFGVISNKNGINIFGNKEAEASTIKASDDSVKLYEIENSKYKGYYLLIQDPKAVKIGYSSKLMTEGETTSKIAEDNDSIAAINGGAYINSGADSTGGIPTGVIMTGGKVIYTDLKEDEKTDLFAITKEGTLLVGKYSLNDLSELGAEEALSFGPSLVINGEMTPMEGDGGWGIAKRTAIGQKSDGTIIMLVIDGKNSESQGTTIKEVQEVMFKLGAVNAINLDGGKSTTMYYNKDIINKPSDGNREQAVPTAIIVK